MTYAVVPALRTAPELLASYGPGLTSRTYDPGLRVPTTKRGLLAGMGMTEKQGGSDVRANTTTRRRPQGDGTYLLTGHKWFTSAPMCDLFLVLAQAPGGLTCFLVPRVLPDGTRNVFRIQRLKDKLGNRRNASTEPEFDGHRRLAGRRRGPRGPDHHRDGRLHPPRLRARLRRRHARGRVAGRAPRPVPVGVRRRCSSSR